MMIKNAIVLLDEVSVNLTAGKSQYDAVIYACASLACGPVFLAAATTVLGVIPLLPDVFWAGLAVTIMAGLTIGTVFTMIASAGFIRYVLSNTEGALSIDVSFGCTDPM